MSQPNGAAATKVTGLQWKSLFASLAGWTLDAMDWMLLSLALPLIRAEFDISLAQAGLLATATLAGAALGGVFVGVLADYFGRVHVLMFTMIWYGVFTAACGFAPSYEMLLLLRFIVGIGLGGEWGVGAALVSEYWPDKWRARATSLVHSGWPIGYGLAAVAYMLLAPTFGWRSLFFVGIIPAAVAIWIRMAVPEPEVWQETREKEKAVGGTKKKFPLATLFSGAYLKITLLAMLLATGALMAYWGSATWLPSYLAGERGLTITKTAGFLIFLNVGAFLGYQFFGWLADKKGRRFAFLVGLIGSSLAVLAYVSIPSETGLLFAGPVYGFITYGFFGIFGAFLSELFPADARASATSLCFNFGRGMSMLSPFLIGAVADAQGLTAGLMVTAAFNIVGVIAALLLPETAKLVVANAKAKTAAAQTNDEV